MLTFRLAWLETISNVLRAVNWHRRRAMETIREAAAGKKAAGCRFHFRPWCPESRWISFACALLINRGRIICPIDGFFPRRVRVFLSPIVMVENGIVAVFLLKDLW